MVSYSAADWVMWLEEEPSGKKNCSQLHQEEFQVEDGNLSLDVGHDLREFVSLIHSCRKDQLELELLWENVGHQLEGGRHCHLL